MENTEILCSEKISLKEPEGCSVFTRDKQIIQKIIDHNRSIVTRCHQICTDIGGVEIISASYGIAEMAVTGFPTKIELLKEYLRHQNWILERPQTTHRIAS